MFGALAFALRVRIARLDQGARLRPPSSFSETAHMALLRLAYVSTSAIAGDPREPESIADILMSSRRNNETAGITGALLATDDRFAQVLEGEQEAVEEA